MGRYSSDAARLGIAVGAVGAITLIYGPWLHLSNVATVSSTFLLIVLLAAGAARLWVAVVTAVVAMLALNFFFLPPVGALTVADPQNWMALFAFIAVGLVASNLSAVARARAAEAISRRDELARLFDLSRDVLVMTDSREAIGGLARSIARRFDLEFVAVALPEGSGWAVFEAGSRSVVLDHGELSAALAAAQRSIEFDARARTYAGHRTLTVADVTVRIVPLRVGTKPIGLLAATGRPIEPGTLDALGGVVAIAIERAHFLEERKAGELTRQSEELKTALLASLGHDLRTPLTAIRVAAANLQAPSMGEDNRRDQSELIVAEVARLTRLFENILEMARIDADAVATESRWTHPSELVAAARRQVEPILGRHTLVVNVAPDAPVCLDPRLTATAVAHLLENAAQYAPAGSAIELTAGGTPDGLRVEVRDHGPGISAVDLPHLFERFYRGGAAQSRASGTGMGLWIARGLLRVEQGRVWADNCPDGGARFTVLVPAAEAVPPHAEPIV